MKQAKLSATLQICKLHNAVHISTRTRYCQIHKTNSWTTLSTAKLQVYVANCKGNEAQRNNKNKPSINSIFKNIN